MPKSNKLLKNFIEAAEPIKRPPIYIINVQEDETCQIARKDHDGIEERWYEGLTHEEAGQLADILNTYSRKEFGFCE